ncbi:hypothetical protein GY45DRAFT_913171 [Cubamyces sp. BRFM 1775]|nr:hypothetical protein GY45DRAFT_913171 [Cubamyces sp. BRFM 1775]
MDRASTSREDVGPSVLSPAFHSIAGRAQGSISSGGTNDDDHNVLPATSANSVGPPPVVPQAQPPATNAAQPRAPSPQTASANVPEPELAPVDAPQAVWDPASQGPYPGHNGPQPRGKKQKQQTRAVKRKRADPYPRPAPSNPMGSQAQGGSSGVFRVFKATTKSSEPLSRRKTVKNQSVDSDARFDCPCCSSTSIRLSDADRHVIFKHLAVYVTCTLCPKVFTRLDSANRHFRSAVCMGAQQHMAEVAAAKARLGIPESEPPSESESKSKSKPKSTRSTSAGTTRANKAVARAHLEITVPCWNERDAEGRAYRALLALLRGRRSRTPEQLERRLCAYGTIVHECACCVPVRYEEKVRGGCGSQRR